MVFLTTILLLLSGLSVLKMISKYFEKKREDIFVHKKVNSNKICRCTPKIKNTSIENRIVAKKTTEKIETITASDQNAKEKQKEEEENVDAGDTAHPQVHSMDVKAFLKPCKEKLFAVCCDATRQLSLLQLVCSAHCDLTVHQACAGQAGAGGPCPTPDCWGVITKRHRRNHAGTPYGKPEQ